MLRNRILRTIASALLLAATTAAAQKPKKPAAVADYFPLRADHSWTYRNTSDASQYTLKVVSEEKQEDGSTRYFVEMRAGVVVHKFFSKPAGWVLLHADRYPEHEGLEMKYEPPKQYLQNPLVAGFKWQWSGKDYTQMDFSEQNRVVGFENVTVPAGKFRAMRMISEVSGAAHPMIKTYWYAGGVGLVKTTTEGGPIKYGSELVDYSFKKDAKK
jgi:hypothetical protein